MKPLSAFGYFRLSMFSKPACNRRLFQVIKKEQCQSFLEIGLSDGQRSQQMLQVAEKYSDAPIRYTGVDLFDARDAQPRLKLIDMHKALKAFDAKCQLVPGAAGQAIERIANSHLRTDIIIVSGETEISQVEAAISFFPRMLHANSLVLLQSKPDGHFKLLNRLDVERWATKIETGGRFADKAA